MSVGLLHTLACFFRGKNHETIAKCIILYHLICPMSLRERFNLAKCIEIGYDIKLAVSDYRG